MSGIFRKRCQDSRHFSRSLVRSFGRYRRHFDRLRTLLRRQAEENEGSLQRRLFEKKFAAKVLRGVAGKARVPHGNADILGEFDELDFVCYLSSDKLLVN